MEETVRCWLVEREFWDEDVVTLVYATTDGERHYQRQLSANLVFRLDVTAAMDVDPAELEAVPEEDRRERYAAEAERMATEHDPDDVL